MENAKIGVLSSAKLVKEEDIIKSVLEQGTEESACGLDLEKCDVIKRVSSYVNRMETRILDLEERVFYESLEKDAYCLDGKKVTVDDVEKIVVHKNEELTASKEEESELESSNNSDKESFSTEKEEKQEIESESSNNSDKESLSTEKEEKEESESESSKKSDEESTFAEKEEQEGGLESESTFAEKEEQEGGLESELISSDKEKTVVISSRVMSLAEIMIEQAMSTEENGSDLKTLTKKEDGFPTTDSGRGFGRGRGFARDCVLGGFGRGHYVRRLQQQQTLVMKEDTPRIDSPIHGVPRGLSMYMDNAKITKTRKHRR